jgi:IS30 family transposase
MTRRERLTDAQLNTIVTMRENGATYEEIGKAVSRSADAIHWHCMKLGADSPRSRWRSWDTVQGPMVVRRGNHVVRRFTPEEDEKLLRLEAQGLPVIEIARQLGRRHNSITGRLMALARRDERRQQSEAA